MKVLGCFGDRTDVTLPLTAARLEHYVGKGNVDREAPGVWKGAREAQTGEGVAYRNSSEREK